MNSVFHLKIFYNIFTSSNLMRMETCFINMTIYIQLLSNYKTANFVFGVNVYL